MCAQSPKTRLALKYYVSSEDDADINVRLTNRRCKEIRDGVGFAKNKRGLPVIKTVILFTRNICGCLSTQGGLY